LGAYFDLVNHSLASDGKPVIKGSVAMLQMML
jgi:hypothetical protein